MTIEADRDKVLQDYRKKLVEHKEVESRLKESELISIYLPNSILKRLFFSEGTVKRSYKTI